MGETIAEPTDLGPPLWTARINGAYYSVYQGGRDDTIYVRWELPTGKITWKKIN